MSLTIVFRRWLWCRCRVCNTRMCTASLCQPHYHPYIRRFGALFTLLMLGITWLLKRYLHEVQTSEMFMTAKRSVKTGLIASAIVSSWTWAATLLVSTEVAYRYGVSGPLWYASGAVVQVLLFSVLAIELKRRAPNAHTCLEVGFDSYGCEKGGPKG